jgi:hypothetical protein
MAQTGEQGCLRQLSCVNITPTKEAFVVVRSVVTVVLAALCIVVGRADDRPAQSQAAGEVMCGLRTYRDSLDLAFGKAASHVDGETLLLVQVLPSFHPEFAIAFKRSTSGLRLFQIRFRRPLWRELMPLATRKTRQQCLEQAASASIDTRTTDAPTAQVDSLWARFPRTNLETDSCPRQKDGRCALIQDGTVYVVEMAGASAIRIKEVAGVPGVRSQNPALLEWIRATIRAANFRAAAE